MIDINEIRKIDPEIADSMLLELRRQNTHIELIASENEIPLGLYILI